MPTSTISNHCLRYWDLADHIRIDDAIALWCGVEPAERAKPNFKTQCMSAKHAALVTALRDGRLRYEDLGLLTGQGKVVVWPDGQTEAPGRATTLINQPLLVALTRAFYWQQLLDDGVVASGSDIARQEGLHHSAVNELLRLTLLEPVVIQSILAEQQPRCMSLLWFQRNPLPTDGVAQREVVAGFDA